MVWRRLVIASALALVALLALPRLLSAHALLDHAQPPVGTPIPAAPTQLRLFFSEPIDPRFSSVQVLNVQRDPVDRGDSHLAPDDPRSLIVSIDQLPDGYYTVAWRTLSAVDGHTVNGAYPLTVGTPPAGAPPVAAASSGSSFSPETALARWWLYLSASVVLGGLVIWRLVLSPVLVGGDLSACSTVERRLRRFIVIGAVSLVLGTVYAGLAQAATAAGVPLWSALGAPLQSVLTRGRYAAVWWPRLLLSLGVLALVGWRGLRGPAGEVALAATPAILLTSSLTSHGAALLSGSYLGIAADWVHLLCVAAWIGGLVALAVGATAGLSRGALARGVARFSNLALACVIVISATGTFQAWLEIGSWEGLFQTGYGHSVLAKIVLLAIMVGLGAFNLLVVRRRLPNPTDTGITRAFRRSVRAEVMIGVLVLAIAALLTGLAPAREEIARRTSGEAESGPVDRRIDSQGLSARVQVTPGAVGPNQVTVTLSGADPAIVERVQLTFTYLDAELGSQPVVLTRSGDDPSTWQATPQVLSQPGSWQADLLVRRIGQDDVRGTLRFGVTAPGAAAAPSGTATAGFPLLPTPIVTIGYALIAAGAVLAVYGLARSGRGAWPNRAGVVLAGLVVVAGGGYIDVREQREGVTLDVANVRDPVPADDRSLADGKQIYTTYCAACHGDTGKGDGPAGLRLVPRPADLQVHMVPGVHTDGELFYWVSYGFPNSAMPAWQDTLSEQQRWDVINYARTLVPER